jgi:hypothetical protein
MSENRIDERIVEPDDIADSPVRRFTVDGFKRVPRAYFPVLAIGATVVIIATVMFMIGMLTK